MCGQETVHQKTYNILLNSTLKISCLLKKKRLNNFSECHNHCIAIKQIEGIAKI